jgi:hypothetical protein
MDAHINGTNLIVFREKKRCRQEGKIQTITDDKLNI